MLPTGGIAGRIAGGGAAAVEADSAGAEEEARARLLGGDFLELTEGFDSL